jgi:mannose-6-phosphate isomerase-like protein (cupin superfamily)
MTITKKWGHETTLVNTPLYCFKEMTVVPNGMASSIHYHVAKTETFIVRSGRVVLELHDPEKPVERLVLEPGQTYTIPARLPHRFWCAGEEIARFDEVSTHDEGSDSYRIIESGPIPTSDQ